MPKAVVGGEGFAVVVPDGVELAGGAQLHAFAGEALDVGEGVVPVGVDAGPVVDPGCDPGFDAGVGEGLDVFGVAGLGGVVPPGDGDGVLFELLGEGFDEVGGALGDVAPPEESAVKGLQGFVDLLEVVEVDGAEALRVYGGFGLAVAEVNGFVGADVEEGAGVVGGQLGKHLVDELEGAGLGGGEHGAVGGFGDGAVLLPVEIVVEVAERLLVGDDGDVVTGGIGGELAGFGRGDTAAGGCGERVGGVLLGVLEVGRVDVGFVGGEGSDELLLEVEGADGAAGEVVLEAAVLEDGEVADVGEMERGLVGGVAGD